VVGHGDTFSELFCRVHDGIHFAPQRGPRGREVFDDLSEAHVTNDKEVDVALGGDLAAGKGTKHESNLDLLAHWIQRGPQNVYEAHRLHHNGLKLREDGAPRVRPVVDLIAAAAPRQNAGRFECAELALHCARCRPRDADDLADVELLIGSAEEKTQEPPARSPKERGGEPVIYGGDRTHYANYHTQFEYSELRWNSYRSRTPRSH